MAKLLIINGPNLNLLGSREPDIYGDQDLESLSLELKNQAEGMGHQLTHFQSNAEHALIERIHQAAKDEIAFIIINPAGLTHTSVVLRDALLAVQIPFIEVHLSNIFGREPFRRKSFFSDIAEGVITGLGTQGYELALEAADRFLKKSKK